MMKGRSSSTGPFLFFGANPKSFARILSSDVASIASLRVILNEASNASGRMTRIGDVRLR
jgi:hypothetical protein